MGRDYCPARGDVVWISFNPRTGHEQTGHRPALVLSPLKYNRKAGLAVLCPITTKAKGYPFEVEIPDECDAGGVVLSDQVKSLDWQARKAKFFCELPEYAVVEVLAKVNALLR